MSRNGLSEYLLYLAVLVLPLSYGTKDWFSLDVRWIPPSLLLALLSALLRPKLGRMDSGAALLAILVCWALVSSLRAALFWPPEAHGPAALYRVVRYPVLLALSAVLFLRARASFSSPGPGSQALLSCLSLTVALEAALAIYLVVAASVAHPLPLAELGRLRCAAQTVYLGDVRLCRLTGTYKEGPQFGLFMLVSLVVLSLASTRLSAVRAGRRRLLVAGSVLSAAGVFASLSDQIFIGAAVFLFAATAYAIQKRRLVLFMAALVALGVAAAVSLTSLTWKWSELSRGTQVEGALGSSWGERLFHAQFVLTEIITGHTRFCLASAKGGTATGSP